MSGDARTGELAIGDRGFGSPPGAAPALDPTATSQSASTLAITAMILGIAAWVVGGIFFSVPGWIVAKMELARIARGESPPAGKPFAQVGYWASVMYTILFLVLVCVGAAAGLFFVFGRSPGPV